MTTLLIDPYDEFLYPNYSYPQTNPDRLASLATLFGMEPASPENCRVLELGCGDGANLLPMAFGLRHSEFVGVDRARQPIARGQAMIAALELQNVELKETDLQALPDSWGKFDYIIAHGLYSWVPAPVQDRILEICRSFLAPQGVAYISYNVYPGCHLREITRGMIRFHVRELTDPRERVSQARALTKWLNKAQTPSNAYSLFLKDSADHFADKNDGAICHDDLADINVPVYLHQFVTHAARHGLQFLSEAEYFDVKEDNFAPEVADQLRTMGEQDVILKEQYLDFLEGRSFRQTLLCHHEVKLERSLRPDLVRQFLIRSQARPVSTEPNLKSEIIEEFKGPKGGAISTSFPLAKAALLHLGEIYPHSTRFDDLLARANDLVDAPAQQSEAESDNVRTLAEILLKTYGAGVSEFCLHEPEFTLIPGERPLASPLARLQAQHGTIVTSLLYNTVRLDDWLGQRLLSVLDGTRDRKAVLKELQLYIEQNSEPSVDLEVLAERAKLIDTLGEQLDEKLAELGRLGFLLA